MILDDVHRGITKHKKRKRIGRGPGSGHGKMAGRGHKGYFSRSGSSRRTGFEGGQTPLFMRIAKRGFSNNAFRVKVAVVNLSTLEEAYESGATVTVEDLKARGLTNGKFDIVKILGNGDLSKKLTVKAHRFSESAQQKIAAAGGTTEILE